MSTAEASSTSAGRGLAAAIGASLLFSAAIWYANARLAGWELAVRAPGGPRIYPWQLAEPGFWTHASAWAGYVMHQLTVWWLIWKAQSSSLRYTRELKPLNLVALGTTAGFVALHFVQTHLFYDGLAQDVPEWTAMWSVIVLLLVVLLMENRRRGIALGIPAGGFVEQAGAVARRYHGYYFAWATIYTFWYHPMVFTQGHALGFLYMFLLLTQGALMFTRMHVNRWWTLTLELLVILHGVLVAFMNVDGLWHMFGFGLAGIFFVTQSYGLGWKRSTSHALLAAYVAGVLAFYSQWGWQDFPAVFRIIGGYVVAIPLLALLIVLLARAFGLSARAQR
ncbi:MAG: hypothetical protein MUF07_13985 [Steroidobacteraceae bacterium]|jgi:hypothetical protein|nr:hypothetical protein [Steroidobacteraceae bacterium]